MLATVLDYLSGTPRKLDVSFVPSPSGGGMYFSQEISARVSIRFGESKSADHGRNDVPLSSERIPPGGEWCAL
jgi:hypothetical protein